MLSTSRLLFLRKFPIATARSLVAGKPGASFFIRHCPAVSIHPLRYYSETSCKESPKKSEEELASANSPTGNVSIFPKFLQPYLPAHSRGWVVLGSGIVALGVSRVFYGVTYSFLGLTPATSLYYGFIGGLLTAGSSAAVVWWGDQTFRVAPERAVQYSLEILNKSPSVATLMSGAVYSNSVVRSYSVVNSQIGFKNMIPKWISPYVEIAYTVKGKTNKEAVVTCVYGKKGTKEVIDYLAIEPTDETSNKVVVVKKDALFTISASLKKHAEDVLQTK